VPQARRGPRLHEDLARQGAPGSISTRSTSGAGSVVASRRSSGQDGNGRGAPAGCIQASTEPRPDREREQPVGVGAHSIVRGRGLHGRTAGRAGPAASEPARRLARRRDRLEQLDESQRPSRPAALQHRPLALGGNVIARRATAAIRAPREWPQRRVLLPRHARRVDDAQGRRWGRGRVVRRTAQPPLRSRRRERARVRAGAASRVTTRAARSQNGGASWRGERGCLRAVWPP
jgi:hypothetical protein